MAYLPIKVNSINIPGGTAPYVFTVQIVNTDGTLNANPNIIQNQQFTRATLGTPFTLQFQLGNGVYNISNVRVRILYGGEIIRTGDPTTISVNCSEEQFEESLFSEISYIGITRDNTTRETSLYFTSTSGLSWRIGAATDGVQPQGLTIDNQPWNNTTWNPVTTDWAVSPITHIARINPLSAGNGGLIGGAPYHIDLRLNSNPNKIYRMSYTIPNNNVSARLDITPVSETCNKGGYSNVQWRGPYESHGAAETAACLDSGTGGIGMFSTGVSLGSITYAAVSSEDCTRLANGYYYFKIGNTLQLNTARVTSGVIDDVEAFSCGAPSLFNAQVGTKEFIHGDYQYNIITSANAAVEITGGGLVKISAPYTKPSFNGNTTCYRHVIGDMHQEIKQVDRDALFGAGLDLPEGNHSIFFIYGATGSAPNYELAMNQGQWTLFSDHNILGNGERARNNNSAQMEAIYISKVKITVPSDNELRVPSDLLKLSWLPGFQALGYSIAGLPSHQWWGTTRVLTTDLTEPALAAGANRLTSLGARVQNIYGFLSGIPISLRWRTIQALVPQFTTDAALIANTYYQGREQVMAAEVAENVGNNLGCPPCYDVAKATFSELHIKAVQQGAASPADHNFCGDYFGHLYGEDNGVRYRSLANGRMLMASQANARLRHELPHETDQYATSGYFSGAYDYRNWMEPNYLDAPIFNNQGGLIYSLIRQVERKFMAAPNRKVMLFTTQSYEGVNMDNIRTGIDYRLRFESKGGDLIRRGTVGIGFATHYAQCLWAMFLGASPTFWDVNIPTNSDPATFEWGTWATDWDGNLTNPSMVRWQPDGATNTVQWSSADGSHPTRVVGSSGLFPARVLGGENGAYAAAYLYRLLKVVQNRMGTTLEWANFSYTLNGGPSIPGYGSTNVPITGTQGAKVNTWNTPNPGQSNAITAEWNKSPLALYFEGSGGKGVLYQWPLANLSDVQVVTVNNGSGITFTVKGNHPHIFLF